MGPDLKGGKMGVSGRSSKLLYFLGGCLVLAPLLLGGCGHFAAELQAGSQFEDADALRNKGEYQASLDKYEEIIKEHPVNGDAALFEMGMIYSSPKNAKKDLYQSLVYFQKILDKYPTSKYRYDSEIMMSYLNESLAGNVKGDSQQTKIRNLQQDLRIKDDEIAALGRQVRSLDQKLVTLAVRYKLVDKIVIEKKAHRLMLLSKGDVLKTYRIALGGDTKGPKEMEGDKKTPEGTYSIDSRNKNSFYHISLHISYPNEVDKKLARRLGISPGGGIAIHGTHGFSRAGDLHKEVDWTDGCIAVTNEEIEELDRLIPNGMVVEIKP